MHDFFMYTKMEKISTVKNDIRSNLYTNVPTYLHRFLKLALIFVFCSLNVYFNFPVLGVKKTGFEFPYSGN